MGAWLPCGFKGLVEKLSVKLVVPKERRGRVGVSTVPRCIHLTRSHDDNATLSAGLGKTVGIIVKFDRAIRLNTNARLLTLQLFLVVSQFRLVLLSAAHPPPWPSPQGGGNVCSLSPGGRGLG